MAAPAFTEYAIVKQAPFKRLKMKHRRIIRLHMEGLSATHIAQRLDTTPGYIYCVLNNEAVKPILGAIYSQYDKDLKALYPLVIDGMRDALEGEDMKAKLKAADLYFKTQSTYDKPVDSVDTAESIIEVILDNAGDIVKRVKYTERKFLSSNVQNPDSREVIDVTST